MFLCSAHAGSSPGLRTRSLIYRAWPRVCSGHVCSDSPPLPPPPARDPEPIAVLLFCPACLPADRGGLHIVSSPVQILRLPQMVIFAFSLEVKWLEYSSQSPIQVKSQFPFLLLRTRKGCVWFGIWKAAHTGVHCQCLLSSQSTAAFERAPEQIQVAV